MKRRWRTAESQIKGKEGIEGRVGQKGGWNGGDRLMGGRVRRSIGRRRCAGREGRERNVGR